MNEFGAPSGAPTPFLESALYGAFKTCWCGKCKVSRTLCGPSKNARPYAVQRLRQGFPSHESARLVELDREPHAALVGGLVRRHVRTPDAVSLLQSERVGSATYHTQFMTNNPDKYCDDEPVVVDEETGWRNCNGTDSADEGPVAVEKLAEIEAGTTVSFVEQASASGYIFPATIFIAAGIDPENDIDPIFAGGHDSSVIAVCEGDAEVGVAFDDARGAAETDCDIAENVVVFAYGPEIPNDGWAVLGSLPDDLKEDIKQALLDYAASEEGAQTLNDIYEIDNLVEADQDAFTIVEDAARELGIEGD